MKLKSNRTKLSEVSSLVEDADANSRSVKRLLQETIQGWTDDNGPRLAAALAYYALFSLAPLLMIAMSLAGATLGRKSAEAALEFRFYGLVGPTGAQVIQSILQDAHRPGLGIFTGIAGSVLLMVGASAIFVELQDAFNTIWHVESERSGLWQIVVERFLSFLLVLITEALLLLSVLLSTLESILHRLLPSEALHFRTSARIAGVALSIGIATLLFGMMFKFLPPPHIHWRDVWPAALLTAIMFDIGKQLIALYLEKNDVISAYGAANSLVVLIGWAYYSAMILYFGAEFTKVYSKLYGVDARRRAN
jgi:membrane protein